MSDESDMVSRGVIRGIHGPLIDLVEIRKIMILSSEWKNGIGDLVVSMKNLIYRTEIVPHFLTSVVVLRHFSTSHASIANTATTTTTGIVVNTNDSNKSRGMMSNAINRIESLEKGRIDERRC